MCRMLLYSSCLLLPIFPMKDQRVYKLKDFHWRPCGSQRSPYCFRRPTTELWQKKTADFGQSLPRVPDSVKNPPNDPLLTFDTIFDKIDNHNFQIMAGGNYETSTSEKVGATHCSSSSSSEGIGIAVWPILSKWMPMSMTCLWRTIRIC